jgi:hypothetical protein
MYLVVRIFICNFAGVILYVTNILVWAVGCKIGSPFTKKEHLKNVCFSKNGVVRNDSYITC